MLKFPPTKNLFAKLAEKIKQLYLEYFSEIKIIRLL